MEHSLENLTNALIEHLDTRHISKSLPWEIKISEISGRGMYATRDIACDDVILVDVPIIIVQRFESNRVICVQCYTEIGEEVLCKNGCKLPVCEYCQSVLGQHSVECNVITKWRPKCDKISRQIFRSLYLVRAFLLSDNRLALLKMMQGNRCAIQQSEIIEFISEFSEFPNDKNLFDFLNHTSAVMNTNSFHVIQNGMELRGLYPLAAMLNHSCAPNTRYIFNGDRALCVRAIRPLRKGDELTISYCKLLTSTPMRQLLLRQTKKFHCACNRCADRTEFDTNLSALKCIDDNCTGILLPDDPLNIVTTWTCTECAGKHEAKKIFMLEKMMSKFLHSQMTDHHAALRYCRDKLKSILPPTHQIAIEFKCSLIDKIDESVIVENSFEMEHSLENLTNALTEHLDMRHISKSLPWEIKISEISGRGMYATRDIACSDVILVDIPMIIVPRFESNRVVCVQCYKQIGEEVLCKNGCKLPVCDDCQSALGQHSVECNVITKWRPKCDKISRQIFRSLYLVQAVLLGDNRLALLKMMQGNRCALEQSEIIEFISEFSEFPNDKNVFDFLVHTSAVMNTNAFHVIQNGMELRGLYPLAAMVNHSCTPNTRYIFNDDRAMCVRAIRPLRKGDELTISYCKILSSTPMRQLLLRQTKKFHCACNRCADRTEFDTNLSALKCIDDNCTGILQPDDPLNIVTTWTCTECTGKHEAKKIFMLEKMMSKFLHSQMADHHAALRYCRDKLKSILPPTHQIAIEFKCNLIDKIDESGKCDL